MKPKQYLLSQLVTRPVVYVFGILVSLASSSAYALNYFKLETYPYKTASRGETEVENFTT